MQLGPLIKFLTEFNENGKTVITNYEDHDASDIADWVLSILYDLKCSVDTTFDPKTYSYTIIDRMR